MADQPRLLLTGATGFVGSHIYPRLVEAGFDVLCATRNPEKAAAHDPSKRYVKLDLADADSVRRALEQVSHAVYLVHSIAEGSHYGTTEDRNAEIFRDAARDEGLERIVYLGGMKPRGKPSRHLASRLRTGEILRSGSVPVVELQATMVIGGGSESFRIVRDLAARLPWMVLPRWMSSSSEPVAIRDVGEAIAFALRMPLDGGSTVYAVPGLEKLTGREIIMRTAHLMGHRPWTVSVPVVTPKLSSYWIRLVTRANPHLATELVEGLRSDIVADAPQIWELVPSYRRSRFDTAVQAALQEEASSLPRRTRLVEAVLHRLAKREPRTSSV